MSSTELKLLIHSLLDGINDNATLQAIYALISGSKTEDNKDWGNELPASVKNRLETAIKQSKEDKVISHDIVKAKLKEKFPHLNI